MISDIYVLFSDLSAHIFEVFSFFTQAGKRIFVLYLLTAVLIASTWAVLTKQKLAILQKQIFSPKYWFSQSSGLDLKWITLNHILAFFLILPVLGGQVAWAMSVYRFCVSCFGEGDFIVWPPYVVMALFTFTLFLCEDFSRFFVHYCYHKIPLLWRFHAIHHSAVTMTPLTLYRVHFIEYFINAIRSLLVTGSISGLFIYAFKGQIGVYEVLGVSIFNFLFNMAGSNLRHSHVYIGFGRFEAAFISPAQHQIHHSSSERHLDKNFGASLAIWDKLFGSWLSSKDEHVSSFGLYKQDNPQSIIKQLRGIK